MYTHTITSKMMVKEAMVVYMRTEGRQDPHVTVASHCLRI